MIIYGIDPGINGGVSAINGDGKLILGLRMPTVKISSGVKSSKKKKIVNAMALHEVFQQCLPNVIIIEAVHAMPAQGVTSSFSFGRAAGAVEAAAMISYADVTWVTPRVWKRSYGLDSDKEKSTALATKIFGTDEPWRKNVENGVAEAALIARYYLTSLADLG
jgi:crossover junction endodeoxyribonuclease RuvC